MNQLSFNRDDSENYNAHWYFYSGIGRKKKKTGSNIQQPKRIGQKSLLLKISLREKRMHTEQVPLGKF